MIFTHHPRQGNNSPQDWKFDSTRPYEQSERGGMKPAGFWLSVDDDWRRWCDENWDWPFGTDYHFDVDVSKCLFLETPGQIDALTAEYRTTPDEFKRVEFNDICYYIDWLAISAKYSGIIIAPYQWSRRNDMTSFWYYSWDAASACIWDLSIITEKGQTDGQR